MKGTQTGDRKTNSRKDGVGGCGKEAQGKGEGESARGQEEVGVLSSTLRCTWDLAAGPGGLCQVGMKQEGCWGPPEKQTTKYAEAISSLEEDKQ